jgi:CIC family chloride channel protein
MKDINKLFVIPAFIGVIGGFSAIFVRYVIDASLFLSLQFSRFSDYRYIYLFAIPFMFVVSSIIIRRFLSDATNPTIDSVAKSIVLKKGKLDYKKGIFSVILTAANIGFGVPAGREGPIAKFGGSLTSLFLNIAKIKGSNVPLFVTCGVSSALAATFNAPIAAVVFGFEIILGRLNFNVIIPLSVASSVATIISRYFLGNYPTFYVHKLSYNYIFLLLIPIFSIGFSFIVVFFNTIYKSAKYLYRKCACMFYIKALIGGIVVGTLMFLFPDSASLGYKQVSELFLGNYSFEYAFFLSVVKIVALAITFASGMFGGIFAPSIFVGAFLGFSLGGLAANFIPIDPLSLALIGTASVTAGISNAPFRSSLIIIELTQNYQMAIPILLSSVATLYFVHLFEERVHFARIIMQKGFDIADETYSNRLKKLSISNFIETDIPILMRTSKIKDVMFELMDSSSMYFPVVENEKLVGILSFRDIRLMRNKDDYLNTDVEELMTHNPTALVLNANGMDVFEFISHIEANYIPVINNKKERKYIGMLNVGSFSKFVSFVYLRKDEECILKQQ